MNLVDFENQRKTLLLKKSKGNATEDDLKRLIRVLDLINKAEPSIVSEISKKFMEQDDVENLDFSKRSFVAGSNKKKTLKILHKII